MSTLGREIEATRKSYWEREREAARNTSVLLVEGDDDKAVLEALLRGRSPAFPSQVSVVVAGSRKNVLAGARFFPNQAIHLLIDRDTWLDQDIEAERRRQAATPLHVTSGWCLENLFLAPGFLCAYAPDIGTRLDAEREAWVRAGAFWWTVQRTREAQLGWHEALGSNYGAPLPQLDLSSADQLAVSLSQLLGTRETMADLSVAALAANFQSRLAEILALPPSEQWQHVHGKRVVEQRIIPMLVEARGRRADWRVELAGAIGRPAPAPFDVLLAQILP